MSARLACLIALAIAPALQAEEVLWQGARFGECRVSLDLGDASLSLERARGRPRLVASETGWSVAPGAGAGAGLRLAAVESGTMPTAPLQLQVPPRCHVDVATGTGSIEIGGEHRGALRASSVRGAITLWVEPGADLDIAAATSGDLTVDFGVDLEYLRHSEPAKRGKLVTGSGGTAIELGSKQGAVRVLRAARRGQHGTPAAK